MLPSVPVWITLEATPVVVNLLYASMKSSTVTAVASAVAPVMLATTVLVGMSGKSA